MSKSSSGTPAPAVRSGSPAALAPSHPLETAAQSDVGLVRSENEDTFRMDPDLELFVLADGMGGHQAGGEASRMAAEAVVEIYREAMVGTGAQAATQSRQLHRDAAPAEPIDRARDALNMAINGANSRICKASASDPKLKGMGTTIVVAAGVPGAFLIGHVGDSRAYLLRSGTYAALTKDHSLLNLYLETGRLRPEQAQHFADKHVIVRALGLTDHTQADFHVVSKVSGDLLVLCSDGLSDMVDDLAVEQVLAKNANLGVQRLGGRLIRMALQAGGVDNVTLLLIRVGQPPDEERRGSRSNRRFRRGGGRRASDPAHTEDSTREITAPG